MDKELIEKTMKTLETIENNLKAFSEKSEAEMRSLGKVTTDTQTSIENLGTKQREFADELLRIKQRGVSGGDESKQDESLGAQFCKSEQYKNFVSGSAQKAVVEIKNTVTNTIGNTFSQRQPGVVSGAEREFTLESLLNSLPTTQNAVDYVRENAFTNSAAETAEGVARPESAITTTLVTEPVCDIGHWVKVSKQLAQDNAALAAYINMRMIYGVNLRVENQIIQGNGTAPNISGFTKSGSYTAHGYSAAAITALGLSATNRLDLIGLMLGDCQIAYFPADAIILNPADWWKLRLTKDTTGRYLLGDPDSDATPSLFGVPVVSTNAVTADNVMVASLRNAGTLYNRDGIIVEMSESDSDNFTKKLVTIRAERRVMLAVERPSAVRYGDLTPS